MTRPTPRTLPEVLRDERDPKEIVDTIITGLEQGGYDEASLTSLSTTDYTCLTPLVKALGDLEIVARLAAASSPF